MKKHNTICRDYAAAARRVGFSGADVVRVCSGCGVPLRWGVCVKVAPGECNLFGAMVERFAVCPPPPVSARPCDFITGECREYLSSVGGWGMARKLCAGCSGARPGSDGCAVSRQINARCGRLRVRVEG